MKKLSIREVAEIIGIATLVVSIVLLAYEIRQTRLAMMGQTILTRAEISNSADQALRETDYLASIYVKVASGGFEALTPVELESVWADLEAAKTRFSAYYYQYELGLMDEEFYQYDFLPNISWYKPLWDELGVLDGATTRPSFKLVVESVQDYGTWDMVLPPSEE